MSFQKACGCESQGENECALLAFGAECGRASGEGERQLVTMGADGGLAQARVLGLGGVQRGGEGGGGVGLVGEVEALTGTADVVVRKLGKRTQGGHELLTRSHEDLASGKQRFIEGVDLFPSGDGRLEQQVSRAQRPIVVAQGLAVRRFHLRRNEVHEAASDLAAFAHDVYVGVGKPHHAAAPQVFGGGTLFNRVESQLFALCAVIKLEVCAVKKAVHEKTTLFVADDFGEAGGARGLQAE